VRWRSRKLLIELKSGGKTSHQCKKVDSKFKSRKDNKRKVMNIKKKEPLKNLYKRYNLIIHNHNLFADLLGLITFTKVSSFKLYHIN